MTRQEILEKLADIMGELFEVPRNKVVPEATLYDDLDLDSIDAIDLILKIEALTGRRIVPQDFKHVRTVGDILDCVETLLSSDATST